MQHAYGAAHLRLQLGCPVANCVSHFEGSGIPAKGAGRVGLVGECVDDSDELRRSSGLTGELSSCHSFLLETVFVDEVDDIAHLVLLSVFAFLSDGISISRFLGNRTNERPSLDLL